MKEYQNPYFRNQSEEMILSFLNNKNYQTFNDVPVIKNNVLNIDVDKIFNKYFNEDIEKFDDEKLNDMKIDFKEVLYLIDSNKKKDDNENDEKDNNKQNNIKQNILDFFENENKVKNETNINENNNFAEEIMESFGGKIAKLIDI